MSFLDRILGKPIASAHEEQHKVTVWAAIPMLGLDALANVNGLLEDELRGLLGDSLNVHTPLRAGHHHGASGGAVHQNGKVNLAGDVKSLGHHDGLHGNTLRTSLLGDQVVPKHLLGHVTHHRGTTHARKGGRGEYKDEIGKRRRRKAMTPYYSLVR